MGIDYIARDYQSLMVDHILKNPRCALWVSMGLGKTVSVLTAIDKLHMAGFLKRPVLVLAPLRVARTTWPEEIAKWNHTKHLSVSVVTGNKADRELAITKKADIYAMNYDNLKWLSEYHKGELPYDMIVADEATALKGLRLRQGTKRARILAKSSVRIPRFVELTGTPAPNGLVNLWGQMFFIDGGVRLGRTFSAFKNRWFRTGYNGFGCEPLEHAHDEIENSLKDVCLSIQTKDYFDVDAPIETEVLIDLPDKARKIYDDVERKMFAELQDGGTIEAVHAAAKTMKTLQIASGAAYLTEGDKTWEEIHKEKIEALQNIIEEACGAPILVSYTFKCDLERLLKAFKQGRVLDKDPQTLKDWNAGKIPLLFAHPASAGHGLNLQDGGNILVFFSIGWNLEHHQQIIERIGPARQKQSGHDRPVYLYYIMARNTVESLVKKRLQSKESVQNILLEAMKKRNKQ